MRGARIGLVVLTILLLIARSLLAHLPQDSLPHILGAGDKVKHFLAYAALGGLMSLTCWVFVPRRPRLIWVVLLIGMAFGAIDELTQPWTGRSCDVRDWVADTVGTFAGIVPVAILQRFVRLPVPPPRRRRRTPDADVFHVDLERALTMHANDPSPRESRRRPGQ